MTEKYGFVYIWYDRKHKRYYIGCRWGREDDGYICSSRWMRKSYKRRPDDFKRRIIARIYTSKKDLLDEEYRWLKMIPKDQLGKQYYNLRNDYHAHWSATSNAKTIGQKISESHAKHPNWGHWSKGRTMSDATKEKLRNTNKKQFENEEQRELRRRKSKELWADPVYRQKQIEQRKKPRKPLSEETKRKIGLANAIGDGTDPMRGIYKIYNKYWVKIRKTQKGFYDLEEAKTFRQQIINGVI